MKYLHTLALTSLVISSSAMAQEITVAQPAFPELAQQKQLEFTPPTEIGELLPATELVAEETKRSSKNEGELEAPIVLGKNGELVVVETTKSE